MNKRELERLMNFWDINRYELPDIFAFVSALLSKKAKDTEVKEPENLDKVIELYTASNEVEDLMDYIDEIEKKE